MTIAIPCSRPKCAKPFAGASGGPSSTTSTVEVICRRFSVPRNSPTCCGGVLLETERYQQKGVSHVADPLGVEAGDALELRRAFQRPQGVQSRSARQRN